MEDRSAAQERHANYRILQQSTRQEAHMFSWITSKVARVMHEIQRLQFNASIAGIWDASPIRCAADGPTVLTMLSSRDVNMYLLAVKSLARFCAPRRVIVLDDGSLTDDLKGKLGQQVRGIEFVDIRSVDLGRCQAGGTWERLCLIGAISADEYVMQMDADVLCLRHPEQLIETINARRAFTMPGDLDGSRIVTALQAADLADKLQGTGFQLRLERQLRTLSDAATFRYVRGCSAIAGFPPGSISLSAIETVHAKLEQVLGRDQWLTWGSEQITSNVLVANCQGAVVLDGAEYCSYFPEGTQFQFSAASMIHFIGTHRFERGLYQRLAKQVLRELHGTAAQPA